MASISSEEVNLGRSSLRPQRFHGIHTGRRHLPEPQRPLWPPPQAAPSRSGTSPDREALPGTEGSPARATRRATELDAIHPALLRRTLLYRQWETSAITPRGLPGSSAAETPPRSATQIPGTAPAGSGTRASETPGAASSIHLPQPAPARRPQPIAAAPA